MNYTDSFTHYLDLQLKEVIASQGAEAIGQVKKAMDAEAVRQDKTIPSSIKLFVDGFCVLRKGKVKQALVYLSQALNKADASPSLILKYYIEYGLGIAMIRSGNFTEAIVELTKASECKHIDSPYLLARIYANLGYIFLEAEDFHKAHYYCELAWETSAQTPEQMVISPVLTNLAFTNSKLGRFDVAIKQFEQYSETLSRHASPLGEFFYHNAFGAHLELLGEPQHALKHFCEAIQCAEQLSDDFYLLDALLEYCRCAIENQHIDHLDTHIQKALPLVEAFGSAKMLEAFASILHQESKFNRDAAVKSERLEQAFNLQSKALKLHGESNSESISQLYQLHSERPQLENAQSLAKNLELISSFGEYLGSHNDLTDMVFRLYNDLSKLMSVDCLALGLYDEATEQLHYEQFIDLGNLLPPFTIDCRGESTLSTYCIKNNLPFVHGSFSPEVLQKLVNNDPTAHAFVGTTQEDYPSVIMIPLTLDHKTLGVLTIQTHQPHAYQDYHMSLIKHLGSYIAVDLQNKQHKKQLEAQKKELNRLANLDPLTGLFNRVSLGSSIQRLQKCPQAANKIAVLLCDVDFYKQYNDSYGHVKGDDVLKEIANLLRIHFTKEHCKVFRFGGAEFLILTECIMKPELEKKVRSFMADLYQRNIEHSASPCSDRITVSIGGAVFDHSTKSLLLDSELIQKADEALYSIKDKGRNGSLIIDAEEFAVPEPSDAFPLPFM
ncbi:diguanylate cyclase [Vibrio sp. THAF190c]|uniref:sensor domain-containing diguanylate cyclase n=1 Tax=Vibrio sp. THAF190c TaxID=2587865 RepID=UPI0012695A12|nr:diguanylate cyclase [Vibrio sp. THAF190c]QFT12395.1 Phytochrome-like protein cph2 [Vibrio sp. THAF190c]